MRIVKTVCIGLLMAVFGLTGVRPAAAQSIGTFPNEPDVRTAQHDLRAKARADECWAGLAVNASEGGKTGIPQFTSPYTANPPCSDVVAPAGTVPPMPKVNQSYVWGLTETASHAWYGTFANGQCVTQGGVSGELRPFAVPSYVCEFGVSPYVPSPLPAIYGDFRPPRAYKFDKTTKVNTEVTPINAIFNTSTNPEGLFPLLAQMRGIRAASNVTLSNGTNVVLLAGPHLDPAKGLVFLAFNNATGAFLGGRSLVGYSNIRHFTVVDGVLYTGVGKNNCTQVNPPPAPPTCDSTVIGGRVLKLTVGLPTTACSATPSPNNPPPAPPNPWSVINNTCFTLVPTEVGSTDAVAAYIARHNGRLYVTTWPESDQAGQVISAVYMSPVVPPAPGGLTNTHLNSWTAVWRANEYEPDLLVAKTYAGGAIASFDGYLYWGSMHIPWQATGPFFQLYCPGQTKDENGNPTPCSSDAIKQALQGTMRSIAIFRGKDLDTAGKTVDLVYGDLNLPVFEPSNEPELFPGTWVMKPNNMAGAGGPGRPAMFGPSGFGDFWNTYTWTMTVWDDRLWVGTMDWSFLSQQGSALINQKGGSIPPELYQYSNFGGDLFYFPSAASPAVPESTNGIGNPVSYGIRTMTATGQNLILGMANPMNLLTDPADPQGFGGLGGWELLELSRLAAENTPIGNNVAVSLANGVSVNYCKVTNAGNTYARWVASPFAGTEPPPFAILDRYDLTAGSSLEEGEEQPEQMLLLNGSADWRSPGCPEGSALATACVPRPEGMQLPRLYELNWTGNGYDWVDITKSESATEVCGDLTSNYIGMLAFIDIQVNVDLTPANAVRKPGTEHTVTATVRNPLSEVVSGVLVNFSITSGPNAGANGSVLSNASGVASFTYLDTGSAAPYPDVDVIQATVGGNSRSTEVGWVLNCDADSDLDIDIIDLNMIRAMNGRAANGNFDARDPNRDRVINGSDYRYCQVRIGTTTN